MRCPFISRQNACNIDTWVRFDAQHFPLPTNSLASISLSPTGNHLAVWEGPLEVKFNLPSYSQSWLTEHGRQYKLSIVTLAGNVIGTFVPEPDPGFGIRLVSWHPSGMFLAVAGADDKVCGILSYRLHTVYLMSLCIVGAYLRVSDLESDSYARPSNTHSCRRGT